MKNQKTTEKDMEFAFDDMDGLDYNERSAQLKNAFKVSPEERQEQLTVENQKLLFMVGEMKKELNGLLEENIQLGEAIEQAQQQYLEEKQRTKELSYKMKGLLELQDTGKLSLHAKLIQMKLIHKSQKEEIEALKEKMGHIGRTPIKAEVIDKMVALRNNGYSYTQIAKTLGISKSVISKYLNKPENRKKLESDHSNRRHFY